MKLFAVTDKEKLKYYKIDAIHDEYGYQAIREILSSQYSRNLRVPRIQITKVDRYKDRSMHLVHNIYNGKRLDPVTVYETLYHIKKLWEFPVRLVSVNESGKRVNTFAAE
jgi:spore cortex formation protein SpoVR/YcgB (stage V sporulation)